MSPPLHPELRRAVASVLGLQSDSLAGATPIGGGCIHQAVRLELADGRRFFLKWHPSPPAGAFEREAEGLTAVAAVGALRVPRHARAGGPPEFLIMEWIDSGEHGADFFVGFGRALAEHHLRSRSDRYGLETDNYLGSTPQPNGWWQDWTQFWRERRLGFQLELARRRGLSDPELDRLGDRLLGRLEQWLADSAEPPCLLHGDLWGGNYMVNTRGEPVLIDPAVYYGRREADLAMTRLFGGFEPSFYDAYQEVWPLEPGASERNDLYELYHLLNHLNLFGQGYRGACVARLKRLV